MIQANAPTSNTKEAEVEWFYDAKVKAKVEICSFEGGNRQNRLYLESRTPSWARLWPLSYMPSVYENDIPTGKLDPWKEEPQGSYLDPLKNALNICVTE